MASPGKVVRNLGAKPPSDWQRLASWLTGCLGSWWFVGIELLVVAVWLVMNWPYGSQFHRQFDVYPFGLLGLLLTLVAALATPMILMGQDRQAKADRSAAEAASDYAMATGETLIKDVLPILAKQQEAIEEIQAAIAAWGQPPAS